MNGADSTASFAARVGARIRQLRKRRGWSVQELAEASATSRRMLTQIELGQANPSLATVDRIARALGTDFAALSLPDEPPSTAPQADRAEGTLVWQGAPGSRALLLGATSDPRAELWRWTLAPHDRYDAEPDRPGAQEVHHVLAGTLTLVLETGRLVLRTGQSAVVASDQDYSYVNDGDEPATFVRVVVGA